MPHIITEINTGPVSFTSNGRLHPPPGSEAETAAFNHLQQQFTAQFESVFPDKLAAKTVIIIPSLTLDQDILSKVNGHFFYEERMLCLLMLLRMPRTHLIFVTSVPIDPSIVDYYLHLLPGVTGFHARQRLTLLSCFDAAPKSLTEKILERPRLMERIRQSIPAGHLAHISFFNVTALEKTLAVRLGCPLYGCDPALEHLGSKSGSRILFRNCGIPVPPGYENITSEADAVRSLAALKAAYPELRRAVIKINEGFSGEGNAVFTYGDIPSGMDTAAWIQERLPRQLKPVASDLDYAAFMQKFCTMGGVVEVFVEGAVKTSPSVQCRINPLGRVDVLSTHDQVLGGESGQVFCGALFPAAACYAAELGAMGMKIGKAMREQGVLGRFAADFVSVKDESGWKHYAIEINLRKGGTTHPYLMLQFLTNGQYDAESGRYLMHEEQQRCYHATDNLQHENYRGLTPYDLLDIAVYHGLHYDGSSEEGVIFHLIGALSQYGKLGMVCVGKTQERAAEFYRRTVEVLNRECK